MPTKTYRLGELFCGPGGIGRGALNASIHADGNHYKIEHAWANDIDSDSCKTYRENFCKDNPGSVICADVRNLDFKKLKKSHGDIQGLTFGFPCNDFSLVGEQKGLHGKYGPLYTYGVKAIKVFQPTWFMAENVGGLRSANGGKALERVMNALRTVKPGYHVTAHYYHFEDYGVPQTRHRLIIVGIKKSLHKIFRVPKPSHLGDHVGARSAIETPPIPKTAKDQKLTKQSPKVIARLKKIKPGENVWNADLPEHLKLNVKGAKLSQIYRRLHPDKPAYTITGSGGGGTHVYHWAEPRALTNRERARLQTFPDNHLFVGSKESVRKQIGMAVPPTGVQVIMTAILKTLAGEKYDWVPASWEEAIDEKQG
jgi:DNA (cytosine-5)-methyltransferase 1